MKLRTYQEVACRRVAQRFTEGRRGVVLVCPTGGGKTAMGASLVATEVARGGRVLWLAHTTELVGQGAAALERTGLVVGVLAASITGRENADAPVQVASIQTALARGLEGGFSLICFDEAHLAAGAEWSTLLTRFPDARRLGLTATPARADGIGLGALFDVIVVASTIKELTALGHLVPLDIVAPTRPMRSGNLAQTPLSAYRAHANEGESAVLFAPNVKIAHEMAREFTDAGIHAAVVTGSMPAREREMVLRAYEIGAVKVLCNVGVLTTGWDSPRSSVGILARRVGSVGLLIQMAGRFLRPFPGKARALLIDLAGSTLIEGIGRPDLERTYSLEGRGIRAGDVVVPGSFCAVCGALLEPDSPTCLECNYERPAARGLTVVDVPMRKLAADYCADHPDTTRQANLRKWLIVAMSKGHKLSSVNYKFKACYRRFPTREEIAAAMPSKKESAA